MTETPSASAPEPNEPAPGRSREPIPWSYLGGLAVICLAAIALLVVVLGGTPGAPAVAPTSPAPTGTAPIVAAACVPDIDFDSPINGAGWSNPEVAPDGRTFIWTTDVNSTIRLDPPVARPFALEAQIYLAMAPDILESLRLSVNGQAVPTEIVQDASGATLIRATVSNEATGVAAGQATEIGISINRTMAPGGSDDRMLGVAFDRMRFSCLAETPEASAAGSPPSGPPDAAGPSTAGTATALRATGTPVAALVCPPSNSQGAPASATPCLAASPNPVTVVGNRGVVTIVWSIGEAPRGTRGEVYVVKDGRPEAFFAGGRRGAAQSRIRAGSVYEFRLYSGPEREQLLASVIVWTI